MKARLFKSERHTQKNDDIKEKVGEAIETQIDSITKDSLIKALKDIRVKKNDEIGDRYGRWLATGGLYVFWLVGKETAKDTVINDITAKLNANQINVREALSKLLGSIVGQTDLHSLKYRILEELFGFKAKTDWEAKEIVEFSILALKKNDEVELSNVNVNSNQEEFPAGVQLENAQFVPK